MKNAFLLGVGMTALCVGAAAGVARADEGWFGVAGRLAEEPLEGGPHPPFGHLLPLAVPTGEGLAATGQCPAPSFFRRARLASRFSTSPSALTGSPTTR